MRLAARLAVAGIAAVAMVDTTVLTGGWGDDRSTHAGSQRTALGTPLSPLWLSGAPRAGQELLGSQQTANAAAARGCTAVKRPFRPRKAGAKGVARAARVLALPRDENGFPGQPPLTDEGKQMFAWDREQGVRPGDRQGHVLFNAHTYPDGSALGNRLLANLHRGDKIRVRGRYDWQYLCYRVVERIQVRADRRIPRYYRTDGPPKLAIVVCSGQRLGPGNWTHRTVWFAKPIS